MSASSKRLLIFALIFAAAISVDAIKFLAVGKPTVVNWESFVHPAWVITASIVLFLAVYFPSTGRVAFWVYFIIFFAAYINVYLSFSETLTYFCMIFNLVLTSVYFFSNQKQKVSIM